MPLSQRQKDGRQRSPRSLDEEYVVFLQGIPPQCRWQELKDFVRQTALHIRQAVVYDDSHGHPTGLGQIIVKNEDEAWRTYNRLSTNGWNGHSLTVTLSLASEPTKPIAGPTKSPSPNGAPFVSGFSAPPAMASNMISSPTGPDMNADFRSPRMPASPTFPQSPEHPPFVNPINGPCNPQYIPFSPESLGYQLPFIFPNDNSFFIPHPTFYASSFDSCSFGAPRYPPPGCVQPFPGAFPHRHSVSGPINHNMPNPDPTGRMSRNVFIQNLGTDSTPQLLKEHLRTAGAIERCELLDRKPGSGARGGHATVNFRTKEEAKRAISLFDNSMFRGSRIRVRFDRERGGSASSNGSSNSSNSSNRSNQSTNNNKNNNNVKIADGEQNGIKKDVNGGTAATATTNTAVAMAVAAAITATQDSQTATPTATSETDTESGKTSSRKNSTEPLVVNGSCVGPKAGTTGVEKDESSQKVRELHL